MRHATRTEFSAISLTGALPQIILSATGGAVNCSRSFVWLAMLGVVALFTLATPDIPDTAFNETELPLTVSFAAWPQARLGLPIPSARRVSEELKDSLEVSNSRIPFGSQQDQHRAPTADLQKLLCVFLI